MLNIFKSNEVEAAVGSAVNAMSENINKSISEDRKKLRWLVGNPPADLCKIMTITPSLAAAMMERNADDEWKNRPHSEKGMLRYSRAMKKGWKLTGEPIIFSKCGRLLNGQNRLMAALHAEATFPCAVMFGIDLENFKYMDIGIARTAGHIFAIEEIPNYNSISAAARLLYAYYSASNWAGGNIDVENDDLLAFYYRHDRIQESYKFSALLHSELRLAGRWSIFTHYICAQKNRSLANEYFAQIADGSNLSKSSPAFTVRKRLLSSALSSSEKLSGAHCAAFVVKGWNAIRDGRAISVLRWRGEQTPDESFPRAI